jgi:hypothetical protein
MLFAAVPAVILLKESDVLALAAGADHAVRPATGHKVLAAVLWIGEVQDGFLKIRASIARLAFSSSTEWTKTSWKVTMPALRRAIFCLALAITESQESTIFTGATSFLVDTLLVRVQLLALFG